MDDHISSPLVNRDDPIPVLQIPLSEDTKSASPAAKNTPKTGRREAFKKEAEKLKSKLEDVGDQYRASGGSLQDRMYAMYVEASWAKAGERKLRDGLQVNATDYATRDCRRWHRSQGQTISAIRRQAVLQRRGDELQLQTLQRKVKLQRRLLYTESSDSNLLQGLE